MSSSAHAHPPTINTKNLLGCAVQLLDVPAGQQQALDHRVQCVSVCWKKNHLKQVLVPVLPAPYCLSITMTHTKARRRRGELVVNNWEGMQSNAVHTLSCTASTQQFETAIKIEFSSQSEAMPHSSQHTARYMHMTQSAPGSCATT